MLNETISDFAAPSTNPCSQKYQSNFVYVEGMTLKVAIFCFFRVETSHGTTATLHYTKRRRKEEEDKTERRWHMLVDIKKGYEVTCDLIRDLKKPVDHEKAKNAVHSYKESRRSIKVEVFGKGTLIGPWTKDTLKNQLVVSSNGNKTKMTTMTTATKKTRWKGTEGCPGCCCEAGSEVGKS